ncbi:MAG: hypothetical protein KIT58_13425 [Planctomycetota bacterium]|nr:hypothetical protein [Planctomycetota bacterium]
MRTSGFGRLLLVSIAALGLVGCGGSGGGGGKSRSSATTTPAIMTMSQGRAEHSATLLPSGEVLVIGGVDISGDPVATSVIIGLNSVRSGPDLAAPRVGHTATLLTTGQVLVAGGSSDAAGASVLDTTELYDPVTNTFAPGPDLAQARTRHVAASYVRPQGEFVLFAGGSAGLGAGALPTPTLLDTAEVLDVAQGASTAITARLAAPQVDARVARLDTGGVLIVSGANAQGAPAPAQVFNGHPERSAPAPAVVARTGAGVASRGGQIARRRRQARPGSRTAPRCSNAATGVRPERRLAAAQRDAWRSWRWARRPRRRSAAATCLGRGRRGRKLSGASLGRAWVSGDQPLASIAKTTAAAIGGTS